MTRDAVSDANSSYGKLKFQESVKKNKCWRLTLIIGCWWKCSVCMKVESVSVIHNNIKSAKKMMEIL